jgi:hypothetical protein
VDILLPATAIVQKRCSSRFFVASRRWAAASSPGDAVLRRQQLRWYRSMPLQALFVCEHCHNAGTADQSIGIGPNRIGHPDPLCLKRLQLRWTFRKDRGALREGAWEAMPAREWSQSGFWAPATALRE